MRRWRSGCVPMRFARAGRTSGPQQLAELARLVPEIREQFPELELLGPGQPSPLAESWQRLHFYESLSAAFGKSRKPILLYLDDMQWCDPDSFEWLNALLTSPAAAGVLVLGTVRAEETGREHPFTRFLAGLRQSGMVAGDSAGAFGCARRRPNWRASNPRNRSKAETWERSSGPRGAIRCLWWRACAPDCRARGCMP